MKQRYHRWEICLDRSKRRTARVTAEQQTCTGHIVRRIRRFRASVFTTDAVRQGSATWIGHIARRSNPLLVDWFRRAGANC